MKKPNKLQLLLTPDLKQQLVSLRNQGKSVREMSEITGVSKSLLTRMSSELIRLGLWSPNEIWKKRTLTIANQTKGSVFPKRSYVKREPQLLDVITINFKGINVQIQKSANIIVTDTVIYVK